MSNKPKPPSSNKMPFLPPEPVPVQLPEDKRRKILCCRCLVGSPTQPNKIWHEFLKPYLHTWVKGNVDDVVSLDSAFSVARMQAKKEMVNGLIQEIENLAALYVPLNETM